MSESKPSFSELLRLLKTKRMLVVLFLGFSSGLPIMLAYRVIKLWLRRYDIELSTIGYFSWLAIPYSWNFMWAFLFDRFTLSKNFGRRRSWLLVTQLSLVLSFFLLALGEPDVSLMYIAIVGTLLCFFSASQDVAVDAYRNDTLSDEELGVGSSLGVSGYRVAMLVTSGFGIWAVDKDTINWSYGDVYMFLGALMLIGVAATLWADEPENRTPKTQTFFEAVVMPFVEFFKRPYAVFILLFVFFYKFGDGIAGSMLPTYYVDLGFSNQDIGKISSIVGFCSTITGFLVGGTLIFRKGYFVSLWVSGVLQAVSTASFVILAYVKNVFAYSTLVFFEDFSSGMGTASLVAFMGHLTNRRFTAAQYALFASLASMGRTMFSGFSGNMIEWFQAESFIGFSNSMRGYIQFFFTCGILAIPGLLFLSKLRKVKVTDGKQ